MSRYTEEDRRNDKLVRSRPRLCAVADTLGGWHNLGRILWAQDFGGYFGCGFTLYGSLATYDWNRLTVLVLAAHQHRVRVEVSQGGPRRLKIELWEREDDPERRCNRHHPGLVDLIAACSRRQP